MCALPIHALVARQPGSEQDLGPFLNVVTWVLLITSALAVLTRLITKRALRRRMDIDDAFVVAALLTSIGSGIAVSVQVSNGLGRTISSLQASQVGTYEKAEYANRLLYIATLAFAKLSIISLLMILTAADLHRRFCYSMTAVIALWGVVSVFVGAFQCGIDEPWRFIGPGNTCSNMPSFWRAMGAINMLTDLALIFFPVHVIATLQMSAVQKLTILIFFGARSLDVIATGVQLAYTSAFSSPDPTRDLWKWTLTTQIIECITILTSCVPYLRPLLESLPSGLYGADEIRRRGTPSELGYSRSKSVSYKLSTQNSTTDETTKGSRIRKSQGESGIKRFMPMLSGGTTSHSNSASGLPGGPRRTDGETDVEISGPGAGDDKRWETDSTGSQAKIVKTTVVSAAWEEAERHSREASCDEIVISRDVR
ncbi:hypothetical protein BU24DRAFT_463171 [Aaosphaeria arxii CBS 175.79]|uniref:Rhodopsin domain-containing protein n=1 Tax=Aaosphaeria arxii CBS 175.79 TaxID=1450172 RepID=A0A6A5XN99_9PLEO|nr:uncharacterized protein BU24DRAFT_463171 [Aaosphaeria arxii CBS 175.79]KAF2014376.1 hypothetical protein BU24DRAFT_463171 [Aaosphaeria arxii CBS 175.79]